MAMEFPSQLPLVLHRNPPPDDSRLGMTASVVLVAFHPGILLARTMNLWCAEPQNEDRSPVSHVVCVLVQHFNRLWLDHFG